MADNNKLKSKIYWSKIKIKSIIEIAQQERKNIHEDIISLIDDQKRFTLDNSHLQSLAKRNLVIVKFIEALIHNENQDQHKREKLFKCAMAVSIVQEI